MSMRMSKNICMNERKIFENERNICKNERNICKNAEMFSLSSPRPHLSPACLGRRETSNNSTRPDCSRQSLIISKEAEIIAISNYLRKSC